MLSLLYGPRRGRRAQKFIQKKGTCKRVKKEHVKWRMMVAACLVKKAGSTCSRMSAALVHSTCTDNCFALDAAFVRSTCFQCSRLRISRFTRPFDSSMNTSTRASSDIRTIYADAVEHARLFKVYRVFKGTRCSVRCAQTCELRLVQHQE
jgi:hypothetical protein